jgi:hypothetical protein
VHLKTKPTLMKNSITRFSPFQIIIGALFLFSLIPFQSCEPDEEDEFECDTCLYVMKPNIYLYPTEKSSISINLSFPLGGKIITSIPVHGNGWIVDVDTSGIINNKYEYLFYESLQPNVWQLNEGWIIKKSELETFFIDNMLKHGFYGREIKDFLDYWIPRLTDFNYYEIYPQESNIIETAIKLEIYKNPDNVLRLFYLIKGVNSTSNNKINIPSEIPQFNRSVFCVTEWGVILK